MAASEAVPPLVLALVAGGFTTFGVLAKIAFDALAARRATKSESVDRFATERRAAYETFYSLVQQQRKRENAIRELIVAKEQGKTDVSDQEAAAFPPTVLGELITANDQVRRLARSYSVITAAEAIVQLFLDMTKASRAALEDPGPMDEINSFILQQLIADRIDEFVHGYREDLGLGRPAGAPKSWPIVKRSRPLTRAEGNAVIRALTPIKIMPEDAAEDAGDEAGTIES
jgi:hypothetical protein